MSQQLSTPRRSLALAAVFLVVASTAFGVSFYLLDGASLAGNLVRQVTALIGLQTPEQKPPTAVARGLVPDAELELPEQMPEEFALRLWQEQVDSQAMIGRLVSGEVKSLRIDEVQQEQDSARLYSTAIFTDGTSAEGVIGLRRFGEQWFIAYVTGMRRGDTGGFANTIGSADETSDPTPLPEIGSVDLELLNTIIREQQKSQAVIGEYLAGVVKEVFIEKAVRGPRTVTLNVEMDETHGDAYARIIAIGREVRGEQMWFLASFSKTPQDATE